jgi:hypothetical protein
MEVNGKIQVPATLPQGNSCVYLLDRRIGGSLAGRDAVVRRKKLLSLPRTESRFLGRQLRTQVSPHYHISEAQFLSDDNKQKQHPSCYNRNSNWRNAN